MSTVTPAPLADIEAEAVRLIDGLSARSCIGRLLGGLAIAEHRHRPLPSSLSRPYGDIDIVVPSGPAGPFKAAMEELGYVPNSRFNNLRGHKRMLFYDEPNGRQIDVFVSRFDMCHGLDLSARLDTGTRTLYPTDVLLTKLQVVEINRKDLVDALTLVLTHEVVTGGNGTDALELGRLAHVAAADWGWYTTLSDNLAKIGPIAQELLDQRDAEVVEQRIAELTEAMNSAPKGLKWKARAKVGRKVKWYELPEEVGQTIVTR